MLQHLALHLAAASVLVAAAPGALAQTPPPATPTTKIPAIGTFAPGRDLQLVQRTLAAEVRATAELYLEGKIDQWYSLENRPGVVFILNVTDIAAAHAMLEALTLGKAHLMTFELYPIGPLKPLRQLFKIARGPLAQRYMAPGPANPRHRRPLSLASGVS
jgi:hypothetical protein